MFSWRSLSPKKATAAAGLTNGDDEDKRLKALQGSKFQACPDLSNGVFKVEGLWPSTEH
jgi:hypothetical protein